MGELYVVSVSKGIISGVAIQSEYMYGPMSQQQMETFVSECDDKGYGATIYYLNTPSTLDTGDEYTLE